MRSDPASQNKNLCVLPVPETHHKIIDKTHQVRFAESVRLALLEPKVQGEVRFAKQRRNISTAPIGVISEEAESARESCRLPGSTKPYNISH